MLVKESDAVIDKWRAYYKKQMKGVDENQVWHMCEQILVVDVYFSRKGKEGQQRGIDDKNAASELWIKIKKEVDTGNRDGTVKALKQYYPSIEMEGK